MSVRAASFRNADCDLLVVAFRHPSYISHSSLILDVLNSMSPVPVSACNLVQR